MHPSFYPPMTIRPDEVIRSGIVQPFSVRSMDPVAFSRHEVDPFISAIRPGGPHSGGVHMDGSLGIVTANRMPLAGFGAVDPNASPDVKKKINTARAVFGVGGIALGALGAWLLIK